MMKLMPKLAAARSELCRFALDDDGTVTIESLIALPLLMFWYIASFTFFDGFRAMNMSDKAAYTISDLISRTRSTQTIDQAYVNGLNDVFDYLVRYEGDTWIRVTSVGYDDDEEKYTRLWSSATQGEEILDEADVNQPAMVAKLPNLTQGETLILVETSMVYNPPFNVGISPTPFRTFIFTSPRFALSGIPYS